MKKRVAGKIWLVCKTLLLCSMVVVGTVVCAWLYQLFALGNFHAIVPGKVYRSAQPSPAQLSRWADRYGIRTVVNLRGDDLTKPRYVEEVRVAREKHLDLVSLRFSAFRLPPRHHLIELIDTLNSAPRPILIHCQSGADRTGLASAMAAMAIAGQSYQQALSQVSLRYLHVMPRKEHMGGLLLQYESWCRRSELGTAGWQQFCRWVRQEYTVGYYYVQIEPPALLKVTPRARQTVHVKITNRSGQAIPLADTDEQFALVMFPGVSTGGNPGKLIGSVRITGPDLQPGQSMQAALRFCAPLPPGRHTMNLDLVQHGRCWFAQKGSPMGSIVLDVVSAKASRGDVAGPKPAVSVARTVGAPSQ